MDQLQETKPQFKTQHISVNSSTMSPAAVGFQDKLGSPNVCIQDESIQCREAKRHSEDEGDSDLLARLIKNTLDKDEIVNSEESSPTKVIKVNIAMLFDNENTGVTASKPQTILPSKQKEDSRVVIPAGAVSRNTDTASTTKNMDVVNRISSLVPSRDHSQCSTSKVETNIKKNLVSSSAKVCILPPTKATVVIENAQNSMPTSPLQTIAKCKTDNQNNQLLHESLTSNKFYLENREKTLIANHTCTTMNLGSCVSERKLSSVKSPMKTKLDLRTCELSTNWKGIFDKNKNKFSPQEQIMNSKPHMQHEDTGIIKVENNDNTSKKCTKLSISPPTSTVTNFQIDLSEDDDFLSTVLYSQLSAREHLVSNQIVTNTGKIKVKIAQDKSYIPGSQNHVSRKIKTYSKKAVLSSSGERQDRNCHRNNSVGNEGENNYDSFIENVPVQTMSKCGNAGIDATSNNKCCALSISKDNRKFKDNEYKKGYCEIIQKGRISKFYSNLSQASTESFSSNRNIDTCHAEVNDLCIKNSYTEKDANIDETHACDASDGIRNMVHYEDSNSGQRQDDSYSECLEVIDVNMPKEKLSTDYRNIENERKSALHVNNDSCHSPEIKNKGHVRSESIGSYDAENNRLSIIEYRFSNSLCNKGVNFIEDNGHCYAEFNVNTNQISNELTNLDCSNHGEIKSKSSSRADAKFCSDSEIIISRIPEIKSTYNPDNKTTSNPKIKVTSNREIKKNHSPEINSTSNPQIKTTSISKIKTTGNSEIKTTSNPGNKITSNSEIKVANSEIKVFSNPLIKDASNLQGKVSGSLIKVTSNPEIKMTSNANIKGFSETENDVNNKAKVKYLKQDQKSLTSISSDKMLRYTNKVSECSKFCIFEASNINDNKEIKNCSKIREINKHLGTFTASQDILGSITKNLFAPCIQEENDSIVGGSVKGDDQSIKDNSKDIYIEKEFVRSSADNYVNEGVDNAVDKIAAFKTASPCNIVVDISSNSEHVMDDGNNACKPSKVLTEDDDYLTRINSEPTELSTTRHLNEVPASSETIHETADNIITIDENDLNTINSFPNEQLLLKFEELTNKYETPSELQQSVVMISDSGTAENVDVSMMDASLQSTNQREKIKSKIKKKSKTINFGSNKISKKRTITVAETTLPSVTNNSIQGGSEELDICGNIMAEEHPRKKIPKLKVVEMATNERLQITSSDLVDNHIHAVVDNINHEVQKATQPCCFGTKKLKTKEAVKYTENDSKINALGK